MSLWKKIKGIADPDPLLDQAQIDAVNEMSKAIEKEMHDAQANHWITRSSLSPFASYMLPVGAQVVHVSDPSLIPPNAQQVSGGQLGSLAGLSSGHIYVDTSTGTIYTTGTQLDPFKELTPEEKERLKNLEEDRKRETKRAKLDIFKKLPANMRQQVVDHFIWSDAVSKMNATEVPKSKEQEELEKRDHLCNTYRGFIGGGYSGMRGGLMDHATIAEQIYGGGFLRGLILPKDITPEELIRAHAEATAEEALLGTDTESK